MADEHIGITPMTRVAISVAMVRQRSRSRAADETARSPPAVLTAADSVQMSCVCGRMVESTKWRAGISGSAVAAGRREKQERASTSLRLCRSVKVAHPRNPRFF